MPRGIYKRKTRTEEHRRNLSKALKGKKPSMLAVENSIKARKGKHHSEEHKKKISESAKRVGAGKWMKGKKQSQETILKRIKKGKEHWNWQGGKSFEPYITDWTETLRRAIRERDNYICQLCGQYGNTVHHIDYNKKNCNSDNLITLCRGCNIKVNYNRNYWKNYFNVQ